MAPVRSYTNWNSRTTDEEEQIEPNAEQIIQNKKDGHQTFISAKGSLPVISVGTLMKFGKIMENKKYRTNIRFCSVLFLY